MNSDNENSDSSSDAVLTPNLVKEVLTTIVDEDKVTITSIHGVFDQLENEANQALQNCHDAVVSLIKDKKIGQTLEPALTQIAKRFVQRYKLKTQVNKCLQGMKKALEELVMQAEKRLEEVTSYPMLIEQEALKGYFIDELKVPAEQCQQQ